MESGTSEWAAVMNRLERLEKQNSNFKKIGAVALILIGSVLLMGQAPASRTVEANEFILKDASGKVRGRLSMAAFGPEFALLDNNGERRASLNLLADDPGVYLFDGNGRERASLVLQADEVYLALSDANEKPRAGLNLVADGPGFYLHDESQNVRAGLFLLADGPRLTLYDANEKVRASLVGTTLKLSDEEGFSTTIGTTDLVTTATGETHKTSAASVVLFDKDKKLLWRAP